MQTHQTLGAAIAAVMKRHRFILMVMPGLFMAASLVFVCVTPARYEAFGLMEVTPHALDNSPLAAGQLTLPNDSMVLSQVEILKSPAVLHKAADQLHIPYQFLQQVVSVAPLGRSFVIRVAAKATTPQSAQQIANTVMLSYQQHQKHLKTAHLDQTTRWLNEHITMLAGQMRQSAQNASAYRKNYDLDDGTATKQQISDLSSQFVQAQMDLTEAQATQSLSSKQSSDKALSQQLSSPVLIGLTQQEAVLRQRVGEVQQKYGPRHPDRLAVQAELNALQAKKAQEIARLAQSVKQDEQVAAEKIDKLHKQFALLQDKTHLNNEQTIQLQALEDEANINRALYETILQRSKEITLFMDFNTSDAQIVSQADLPLRPINPNPLVLILLSGLAGCVVALITLIVSEQLASPLLEADP